MVEEENCKLFSEAHMPCHGMAYVPTYILYIRLNNYMLKKLKVSKASFVVSFPRGPQRGDGAKQTLPSLSPLKEAKERSLLFLPPGS